MPKREPCCCLFLTIPLVLLAACSSPFDLGEQRELRDAEARWERAGPAAYSYEVRLGCFCGNSLPVFTRIDVRADTVAAATAEDGSSVSLQIPLSAWPTVPQLFSRVRQAASSRYTEDMSVRYDPVYGYRVRIDVTCKPVVTDCGELTEARSLAPLR